MDKLKQLLDDITEIEKLLVPLDSDLYSRIKTIKGKEGFENWLSELKYYLKKLKPDPIVKETIDFIELEHWNGFNDEKNFKLLKAKLKTISLHYDEIVGVEKKIEPKMQLGKNTIIKTAFDEYALIKQEGSGGNGRVFSAINKEGEKVAIKFVEKNISGEKLKRFKNEIHFCESHRHENIVEVIDRGYAFLEEKDYVFYVMPLYAETLRDKMKRGIPHEEVLPIILGILKGLKYAHSLGTIHRDIKPENIMFSEDSSVAILCDFGIAHFSEEELLTKVETSKSDRMANFQYAAPEQREKGGEILPQTDIYAVGLILNKMFTNKIPQGSEYTKIAAIDKEYQYLDEVVDLLLRQNAEERLYPIDKIISELQIRAENHQREKEIQQLKAAKKGLSPPENFEIEIINKEYRDGALVFTLDQDIPEEWFDFLRYGHYDHSFVLGFTPEKVQRESRNQFLMPIYDDMSQDSISKIVKNIVEWTKQANKLYSRKLEERENARRGHEEAKRKAEIAELERKNNLNSFLKNL